MYVIVACSGSVDRIGQGLSCAFFAVEDPCEPSRRIVFEFGSRPALRVVPPRWRLDLWCGRGREPVAARQRDPMRTRQSFDNRFIFGCGLGRGVKQPLPMQRLLMGDPAAPRLLESEAGRVGTEVVR